MPWSGGTANADAPTISAALPTATLEAHVERDAFPLQPTEDKPAYIPDAAEVGALAKMLYGEARMVTGETPFGCVGTYTGRKRKKMGVECTAAERLEIEANFAFFKEAMKAELEIFYSAFIQKNNLYPQNVEVRYIEDMTPEEQERALKASMMANGMERHTLLKQITEGGGGYD